MAVTQVDAGVWQITATPDEVGVATITAAVTESGIYLVAIPATVLKMGALVTPRKVRMSAITIRQHHPWAASWIPPVEGWPANLAPSVNIIAANEIVATVDATFDGTSVTATMTVDQVNAVPHGAFLELVHSDGTLLAQHLLVILPH